MRIGELSKRSGLSRDTLRFYEKQGLIQSHAGAAATNNYRDYPEDTLIQLEQIADAQAAGMSIADLILFLSQLEAADCEDFDGEAFLQARIDEVADRVKRSERFLDSLRRAKLVLATPPTEP
ncbi:MerR family transcriptional regulator [Ruegeria jejuensis]|uniref:MerR family transcriptional regulator n=1 Tax=Ruegeria jejuensis TaxID=3233338 RepID=UPI00355AF80E